MRRQFAAAGVAVTLSIVGCGAPEVPAEPTVGNALQAVPSTPAAADVLDVTCSAHRTVVSADRVVAAMDGVHVRVRHLTQAAGMYLVYGYGRGPRRGDSVRAGTTTRVLRLPPGPAWLECSHDVSRRGVPHDRGRVPIEVSDPAKAWRSGAMATFGCTSPEFSNISWAIGPGRGASVDAAFAALVAEMGQPTTWVPAQEGYVAAAWQTYVLLRGGKLWASAAAYPDGRGGFMATLGGLCGHPA